MSRHWLRSFVLVVALAFPAIAQPQLSVVVQDDSEGRLRVTLSTRQGTNVRYIELSAKSMPEYPTVDVTCDRKLPTFPLTRTEQTGNVTVAVYELLPDAIDAMLTATECRLFVPGHTVFLPRNQRWAAWTESSKGTQSPKVLVARVLSIIDGDTIRIALGDRVETLRYVGMDTPETNHPTRGVEPGGREATEVNRALPAGRHVRLEFDVQERDRYGRLLAYVYVGDVMVNAELVRRGYAQVMTIPPNVRHQELFVELHREAREAQRGLWAPPNSGRCPGPC